MRILFADKYPELSVDKLKQKGQDCVLQPDLEADELDSVLGEYDVLVVRSTQVTKKAIEAGKSLKMIIRAGAGTNTIDKDAAAARGIYVCNVPGRNAASVAELAIGLLIAIDRNIPDNVFALRQGNWNKKRFSVAAGLKGRRMGVVGLGAVGLEVLERAHAFGLELYVIDRPNRWRETHDRLVRIGGIKRVTGLKELAERCEILSFHVPSVVGTKKMVDAELLARMPVGAIIINTSRGDIVDEEALIKAMDEKGIRAGLDVFCGEPSGGEAIFESILARHPNVYGTHHIGASTDQAQAAVARGVIEILDAFSEGNIKHCVNMDT
jgi:D-3-phosphoglycerate dehydrogenase